MPIDHTLHDSPTPDAATVASERLGASRLIAELAGAGLVSVEVDDDGDISFTLTQQGRRAARMMAMSRQGHALVLLGALVGTDHGPN